MFGRFKLFGQMLKTGRLALRLARDPRVPMTAKMVLGGTLLYLVSPIDVVPDWLPIAGQADDIMVVLAGLNMFIKACPRWLVDEHSGKLDRDDPLRERRHDEPVGARDRRGDPSVLEGEYRRVR